VNEIKSLRQDMIRFSGYQNSANAMPEHISALKDRLLDQEVSMEWIDIICDDLMELEQEHNKAITLEEVWQKASEKLLEWLEPHRSKKAYLQTRVILFVSTSGVVKTTTIAKLSANYSIKEGKKLGLITADTYRIAAVEQLRTYANIL